MDREVDTGEVSIRVAAGTAAGEVSTEEVEAVDSIGVEGEASEVAAAAVTSTTGAT